WQDGARSIIVDYHFAVCGTDDEVLRGREGGHDYVHPVGASPRDRGQQCSLALQHHVVALGQYRLVEHVVLQSDHLASATDQVAAQAHAPTVIGGGLVEDGGGRRAPVHQQLLALGSEQPDPADVAAGLVVGGQPPEDHIARDRPQQGQKVLVQCHERVALGAVLVRRGVL